jgi:formiminoglutamase
MSIECIENIMGVSTRCSQGIKTDEVIEILKIAGFYSNKISAIDICDYNPFIEDWCTGRLVASMFYYFVLGLSLRL